MPPPSTPDRAGPTAQAPTPEPADPELAAERRALERIRRAQAAHLAQAVARATSLAEEAAEMTEEGIRAFLASDDLAVTHEEIRQIYRQLGGVVGTSYDEAFPYFVIPLEEGR